MKKIKIATAGLGRVGFSRHVQDPVRDSRFEVVACMDKSKERLYEVRDLYDVNIYEDFYQMVDNEDVDIIVIASPTNFHYEQTLYALNKGIDVFLEKPMAINLKQSKGIYEACQTSGKKVMLHQQHRTAATTNALLDVLSMNLIGDIYRVNYNNHLYRVRNDWQALKKYGGGMLYNYGAHYIDVILYIFKPTIKKICCTTNKVLSVGDAEDVVKIILQDDNNITYDIDINMASNMPHPKWVIYGQFGTITITDDEVTIKYNEDRSVLDLQLQQSLAASGRKYDNTKPINWITKIIAVSDYESIPYYDKVYEYFIENKKAIAPLSDSLKVMEIIAECENQ